MLVTQVYMLVTQVYWQSHKCTGSHTSVLAVTHVSHTSVLAVTWSDGPMTSQARDLQNGHVFASADEGKWNT